MGKAASFQNLIKRDIYETYNNFLHLHFYLGLFGQTNDSPKFDIVDFNQKAKVAEWLLKYDLVAWKTSDVVMQESEAELAKLGKEWFCFQDKNDLWHAVYGKYEDGKYNTVFHFTMSGDEKILKSTEKIDQNFLDLHAGSLFTANKKMQETLEGNSAPRFNQYIKQNTDKTFSVWIFPAFQSNGMAVYGGEFVYTIDQTGEKIIKDDSYFQGDFRGFKAEPPREIWLDYKELKKPTLGGIFFVWYYKQYFTKINLDTAESNSFVLDKMWIHLEK